MIGISRLRATVVTALAFSLLGAGPPSASSQAIDALLAKADGASLDSAVALIRKSLEDGTDAEATEAVKGLHGSWGQALARLGRVDAAASLEDDVMARSLASVITLEFALENKIAYLQSLNRPDDALRAGVQLYNVCRMAKTYEAIDRIVSPLVMRGDGGAAQARVFKLRQARQSDADVWKGAGPVDADRPQANLLEPLTISTAPDPVFVQQAKRRLRHNESHTRYLYEANYDLLMGKPDEAKAAFEKASELASDEHMRASDIEGVARAIRAEDGSVGRANAFILSLKLEQLEPPK